MNVGVERTKTEKSETDVSWLTETIVSTLRMIKANLVAFHTIHPKKKDTKIPESDFTTEILLQVGHLTVSCIKYDMK